MDLINNYFILLFVIFNFIICVNSIETHSGEKPDDDKDRLRDDNNDAQQVNDKRVVQKAEDNRIQPDDGDDGDYAKADDDKRVAQKAFGVYDTVLKYDKKPEVSEKVMLSKLNAAVQGTGGAWLQGFVPYVIEEDSYDEIITQRIRAAMDKIQDLSCVNMKPLDRVEVDLDPYDQVLVIANPNRVRECTHKVEHTLEGEVLLVLGYDCMSYRDILHSLMHALGFKDEVTHPQRNHFVKILWENIKPEYRPLFHISTEMLPYKTPVEYDTMSIMHFHDRAFTANGSPTIAPLIPGLQISPTDELSQLDAMKLHLTFGQECNKRRIGNVVKTCKKQMRDGGFTTPGPTQATMEKDVPGSQSSTQADSSEVSQHSPQDYSGSIASDG